MNIYQVPFCNQKPTNWNSIPQLHISSYQITPQLPVQAIAQVCWSHDAIFARLSATEPEILARFAGEQDPVYRDSCLEMFLCPIAEDPRYFNFECNPNGASFWGFGFGRHDRIRLHPVDIRHLLSINVFRYGQTWGVTFQLPAEVIQLFMPEFSLEPNRKMRANFYKCGNDIQPNHELSWNPITNGRADFHQSEFFGELQLTMD